MDRQHLFGTRPVSRGEHADAVAGVFSSVANRYDLMNDLMSAGQHRLWKRSFASWARPRPGEAWLDLATGSGDIAALLAAAQPRASIIAADPSDRMLERAGESLGRFANVRLLRCGAERLPLEDASLDGAAIAFGLRNFTEPREALAELARVLAPGGRLLILEFSPPAGPLAPLQRGYLRSCLPALGAAVAGDAPSYRYLADSIIGFPPPDAVAGWLEGAGFAGVEWRTLAGGIVAMHRGWRTW